jgi:hypothetical protein
MEAYRSVSIIQLDCKGEAVNWAKTITETTQSWSVHLVIYVCRLASKIVSGLWWKWLSKVSSKVITLNLWIDQCPILVMMKSWSSSIRFLSQGLMSKCQYVDFTETRHLRLWIGGLSIGLDFSIALCLPGWTLDNNLKVVPAMLQWPMQWMNLKMHLWYFILQWKYFHRYLLIINSLSKRSCCDLIYLYISKPVSFAISHGWDVRVTGDSSTSSCCSISAFLTTSIYLQYLTFTQKRRR